MYYLCPKCGNFMNTISTCSIPAYIYYKCWHCGYESKSTKEEQLPLCMPLPKELWSDDDNIE